MWSLFVLGRWSSYTAMVVLESAWLDSALVVLDKWSSYGDGRWCRFVSIDIYVSKDNFL